jgi:hypothetical protein
MSFLPEQAVFEYQELYMKYSGVVLNFDEALKKAESLLGFYNLVVFGKNLEKKEDQPMERN